MCEDMASKNFGETTTLHNLKPILYFSIIISCYFISELIPLGDVTIFLFVCAYFSEYFGLKKMCVVWSFPSTIFFFLRMPGIIQFVYDLVKNANSLSSEIIPKFEKIPLFVVPVLLFCAFCLFFAEGFILIYCIHRSLKRLNAYRFPL